jgi:O-antigen/teichoic acid export membrane protein
MIGRRALVLFARTVAVGLMNMLATAVVARLMGAQVLGTIGYLMGLVGMLTVLSDLGYGQAYVKRASEREDTGDYTSTFLLTQGILVAVFALIIAAIPAKSGWQGKDPFSSTEVVVAYYLLGLFNVLGILFSATQRIFLARLEAVKMASTSLAGTTLSTIAKITVAWQGGGLIALSSAFALEKLGSLLAGLVFLRKQQLAHPKWSILKDLTIYAWPQMALIISASLVGNLDRVLLGHLGGAIQVGYYVGVLGLMAIPKQLVSSAMRFFFPRVSQDAARADDRAMRQRLKGALKYLLLITVPLAGLIVVLQQPLVQAYLGPDFLAAAPIAAVLALTVIPTTIILPYQQVIFAVEQHRHLLPMNLLGLVVLTIAGSLLVPTSLLGLPTAGLGALGIAIAVLLRDTTQCLYVIYLSNRHAGIAPWKGILWFLLGGGLMIGASLLILLCFQNSSLLLYALASALGLAFYLALLIAVGQVRRAEILVLWNVVHPLKLFRYIRSELGIVGQEEKSHYHPPGNEE